MVSSSSIISIALILGAPETVPAGNPASSDLNFSLFVGELEEGRKDAIKLHKRLENSSATVLVKVTLSKSSSSI